MQQSKSQPLNPTGVLIGSRALVHYGYEDITEDTDYDIFTLKGNGFDFLASSDTTQKSGKDGNKFMLFLDDGEKKVKVDLYLIDENKEDHKSCLEIWKYLKDAPSTSQEASTATSLASTIDITENVKYDLYIPPLEVLYALKKSHIHRILNLTGIPEQNIKIWNRQVEMYRWMRDKLGYTRMDEVIYKTTQKVYSNGMLVSSYEDPKCVSEENIYEVDESQRLGKKLRFVPRKTLTFFF